jgi:hypothetical protein
MFICEPCLDKNYENFAIAFSLGRCDVCDETKRCADIPSKHLSPKEKIFKMVLTAEDKDFLLQIANRIKDMVKKFGNKIPVSEIEFLESIEPSILSDSLNTKQSEYLIKNIKALFGANKSDLIKKIENIIQSEDLSNDK